MKKFGEILREIFSGNPKGSLSSKRIFGAITLLVALGCTIYLSVTKGDTPVVEGLLQTAYVVAASLLGIASVTGIWKQPKKPDDTETKC